MNVKNSLIDGHIIENDPLIKTIQNLSYWPCFSTWQHVTVGIMLGSPKGRKSWGRWWWKMVKDGESGKPRRWQLSTARFDKMWRFGFPQGQVPCSWWHKHPWWNWHCKATRHRHSGLQPFFDFPKGVRRRSSFSERRKCRSTASPLETTAGQRWAAAASPPSLWCTMVRRNTCLVVSVKKRAIIFGSIWSRNGFSFQLPLHVRREFMHISSA